MRGFADVGDDVFGFDLVGANEVGYGRGGAGFVVVEQAYAFAFEKADAETVCMVVGNAAAAAEAFKGKDDICGGVTVHAEQLAHDVDLCYFDVGGEGIVD
ncbi:hypothetical protein NEISICOT_02347 [Neisseria sicca ATCC 29256]|uniref:Uncharacterized protein n=1 Tax=Neisseria sicca ATCC 29256 TaxID=547045 RepID=C6M744_NEISI|nr:hypothetical protein NEISICOT_02347 [Neisseria sicca ATCC 29256]